LTPTVIQQECSASDVPPLTQSLEQRKEIPWVDAFLISRYYVFPSSELYSSVAILFTQIWWWWLYFGLVYVSHIGLNVYVTPAAVCKKGMNQPLHFPLSMERLYMTC